MAKTKRQSDQERKLQQNIKQSKKLRAEVKSKQKTAAKGSVKGKPSKKKDGFLLRSSDLRRRAYSRVFHTSTCTVTVSAA